MKLLRVRGDLDGQANPPKVEFLAQPAGGESSSQGTLLAGPLASGGDCRISGSISAAVLPTPHEPALTSCTCNPSGGQACTFG